MDFTELFSVPVITAACYAIIEIYKYTVNSNEKYLRFIPLVAAVLGILLAIGAYYFDNSMMPSSSVFSAGLTGLASGLAATGTHQAIKQLSNKSNKCDDDNENDSGCNDDNNENDNKDNINH